MRIIRAILIFLFFAAVIGLVGVFGFVEFKGKQFIQNELGKMWNRSVTVSSVRLVFPIGLRIDDLSIQGVMKAEEVRLIFGTAVIFKQQSIFSQVIVRGPVFALLKTKEAPLSICMTPDGEPEKETAPVELLVPPLEAQPAASKAKVKLQIDQLTVENGRIEYFDLTQEKPFRLVLEDLQLKSRDIIYPLRPIKTKFNFTAVLKGEAIPFNGSRLETKGWIDLALRDMQATLEIIEESGRVEVSSVLEAVSNDLNIRGKINLSKSGSTPANATEPSLDQMVLNTISSSGINLTANFSVKTKLDNIQIAAIAFGGEIGADESGSFKENLKNIGRQFEAIGKKLIEPPEEEKQEEPSLNAVEQ